MARGQRVAQTERKAPACGHTRTGTHTHRHTPIPTPTLFWRFCCFLSFNQTVHKKQEREEELRSMGTQRANLTTHVHTHPHTHSTGTPHGQACIGETHTHTHQSDHKGTLTQYTHARQDTVLCGLEHTHSCTHRREADTRHTHKRANPVTSEQVSHCLL